MEMFLQIGFDCQEWGCWTSKNWELISTNGDAYTLWARETLENYEISTLRHVANIRSCGEKWWHRFFCKELGWSMQIFNSESPGNPSHPCRHRSPAQCWCSIAIWGIEWLKGWSLDDSICSDIAKVDTTSGTSGCLFKWWYYVILICKNWCLQ